MKSLMKMSVWIFAGLFVLLLAEFGTAGERKTDRGLLKRAVENSSVERSDSESKYRTEGRQQRNEDDLPLRAIQVEIGDELASGPSESNAKKKSNDGFYHERSISKKLEREWQDVNQDLPTSAE